MHPWNLVLVLDILKGYLVFLSMTMSLSMTHLQGGKPWTSAGSWDGTDDLYLEDRKEEVGEPE